MNLSDYFKVTDNKTFELEKILLKADDKFFEKLQEKDFYVTDSGDTKIVLEHSKWKTKMIIIIDSNNRISVVFYNNIDACYCVGTKFTWFLGDKDNLCLDDIFNIIVRDDFLIFCQGIRIHEGSKNWNMNIKNVILSIDKNFIDKIQELGFSFVNQNLDILEFMNYKTNTILTLKQYENCIFYNFRNKIGKYFYDNGFAKFLCFTDKLNFGELFKVIKTRDFEIFMEQDIKGFLKSLNLPENFKLPEFYDNDTQKKIKEICDEIAKLLIDKNKKYGNSALEPKNIFYKGNAENSILIRLDDKIGRIINNNGEIRTNDIVDIIGYLVLLLIFKNTNLEEIQKLKD